MSTSERVGVTCSWDVQTALSRGEMESSDALAVLTGPDEFTIHLTFSPDGRILVGVSYDGRVYLWDVAARK